MEPASLRGVSGTPSYPSPTGVIGWRDLLYIRIYNYGVDITFDALKSERNFAMRGIPFDLAAAFEWDSALIVEDVRKDYRNDGSRRWG